MYSTIETLLFALLYFSVYCTFLFIANGVANKNKSHSRKEFQTKNFMTCQYAMKDRLASAASSMQKITSAI